MKETQDLYYTLIHILIKKNIQTYSQMTIQKERERE